MRVQGICILIIFAAVGAGCSSSGSAGSTSGKGRTDSFYYSVHISGVVDYDYFGGLVSYRSGVRPSDSEICSVKRYTLLAVPFLEVRQWDKEAVLGSTGRIEDNGENPLEAMLPVDQPLISLFDKRSVSLITTQGGELQMEPIGERVKVLDTLPICIFQQDTWPGGQYHQDWFHFPLVPGYTREKTRSHSYIRILDTPVASVLRHRNDYEGESKTSVLDTLVPVAFSSVRTGEGEKRWAVGSIPLCSLLARERSTTKSCLTILGTTGMKGSWLGRGNGPVLAMWHMTQRDNGETSVQALRLPGIGPIVAFWRAQEETHWGIFPRLTFWGKFPY